jgi:hypothetical protein
MVDRDEGILGSLVSAVVPHPLPLQTNRVALRQLYQEIPIRFPALYEKLILGYRWEAGAELGGFELLANPPGNSSLQGLLTSIRYDPHLAKTLLPSALVPFARPADGSYDPVCFNGAARTGKHDYQVVQIDHERILCYQKIKFTAVIAPSFRKWVESVLSAR